MKWTRRSTAIWAAATSVAVIAAAGSFLLVSRSTPAKPRPVAAPTHSPAPPPPPKRKPAGPLRSPFTGERVGHLQRVLVVKIDNIVLARPQTGLTHADIIYVLPVEGGLSRFMAVFSSHFPPVIGPVRSARQDDLPLLEQFGRPAFAFSGAQPALLPRVEGAWIINLYAGVTGGYFRGANRPAPYNLFAHTRELLAQARHASKARDIGFRFGAQPRGGRRTKSFSASYSAASYQFRWSAPRHRWLVWMDGAPAMTTDNGQLRPATVVIQYTTIRTSPYLEQGRRPPYAVTTGSGSAVVLRGGRAYRVHWSRPDRDRGTSFTLPSGQRMRFARGQVLVMFAARK
jgi:hypothetical protein